MHFLKYPKMHDNETMALVQGTRITTLHGHESVHTSVIKRPFEPLAKATTDFDEPFEEEDDDDFSDHDSHYSEDMEDINDLDLVQNKTPDMTQKLLSFADMINADIKKFFGKKKDEESCDIYEDKWVTTKSGRELYYADLLRIAHGENFDSKSAKELFSLPDSPNEIIENRNNFSGKMDTKLGLGPLNELFEYGLRHFIIDSKIKAKKLKRLKTEIKKVEDVTPMHQRKLPESFWREPGKVVHSDPRINGGNTVVMHTSHPPDFSDLLQSWTGATVDDFSGELSSSEMSVSPDSVMESL